MNRTQYVCGRHYFESEVTGDDKFRLGRQAHKLGTLRHVRKHGANSTVMLVMAIRRITVTRLIRCFLRMVRTTEWAWPFRSSGLLFRYMAMRRRIASATLLPQMHQFPKRQSCYSSNR